MPSEASRQAWASFPPVVRPWAIATAGTGSFAAFPIRSATVTSRTRKRSFPLAFHRPQPRRHRSFLRRRECVIVTLNGPWPISPASPRSCTKRSFEINALYSLRLVGATCTERETVNWTYPSSPARHEGENRVNDETRPEGRRLVGILRRWRRRLSGDRRRALFRLAAAKKAEAREAEQHQRPGRGFGDAARDGRRRQLGYQEPARGGAAAK